MAKNTSGMRFESREIAVILSLFIFVSLLMFTVGIVVGKGLAQAKYAGTVPQEVSHERQLSSSPKPETPTPHETAPTGTSVSSHPPIIENKTPPVAEAVATPEPHPTSETHWAKAPLEESPKKEEPEPLELKTKKSGNLDVHQDLQADYLTEETEKVLKNANLADLFESEPATAPKAKGQTKAPLIASKDKDDVVVERDFSQLNAERSVASATPPSTPKSSNKGAYSVQVAAYSEEAQALERVDALKKLGFPHAYFSAIELGENKEKWFRVWLGYYPSFESAKAGGEALQARGEVKNYLVRKTENSRTKN